MTIKDTPNSIISNRKRGTLQRWTRTLIPTLRDAPAEASTPSHRLMLRAGCIRQVGAGVYDFLPLGMRVLQKVSQIVREEMDAAGASEMLMPAIVPIELYAGTKRDVDYGDLLFRLTDRHGRDAALGPTHEETVTEMAKGSITSYKQLPLNVYQIQTKFRDEFRPRAGLLRGREFLMKDAYSFHTTVEGDGGLNETYDRMYQAYVNVFTRCGLDFTVVEAEAGPIGGSASHEFMVNAETGEDTILVCPETGYAANVEKCEIGERNWSFATSEATELAKHHTPNMPGIDLVAGHLGVKPENMLKTIVYCNKNVIDGLRAIQHKFADKLSKTGPSLGRTLQTDSFTVQVNSTDEKGQPDYTNIIDVFASGVIIPQNNLTGDGSEPFWVLVTVRGDHEVNEAKVRDTVGFPIQIADQGVAESAGFAIGYVSPRMAATRDDTLLMIDPDATAGVWATGADEKDHHVTGFIWERELNSDLPAKGQQGGRIRVADVRNAIEGDPSPRSPGAKLVARRGIEVGHIFKLGTKYAQAFDFTVLNEQQKKTTVIMGCYGIGVSRTIAASIEQSHDESGILWPVPIAPYHVLITLMDPKNEEHTKLAEKLASELVEAGADVLIDDRNERPGVKFKDADLIGIPVRLTIGEKALADGNVEFKLRREEGKGRLVEIGDAVSETLSKLA